MGCTTSRLVHNPMPILGSAPRAGTRAEQLRRNRKKWCSNLAERGDASSHIPRHFPGTCITSHFLVALFFGAENRFYSRRRRTPSQHPAPRAAEPLAPQDQAKRGTSPGTGHQTTAQGCARGAAGGQGRATRAHRAPHTGPGSSTAKKIHARV